MGRATLTSKNSDRPPRAEGLEVLHNPRSDSLRTLDEQYRQIGEALSICESSSFRVGVPWLPPTQRTRALRKRYQPPLEEFIRYTLVGVNTKTLETYCEDLENLAESKLSAHLPELTIIERYCATVLSAVVVFSVVTLSCELLASNSPITFPTGLLSSGIIGLLVWIMSSETYRRTTFAWLLANEIARRRGMSGNGGNKLTLCSPAGEA